MRTSFVKFETAEAVKDASTHTGSHSSFGARENKKSARKQQTIRMFYHQKKIFVEIGKMDEGRRSA